MLKNLVQLLFCLLLNQISFYIITNSLSLSSLIILRDMFGQKVYFSSFLIFYSFQQTLDSLLDVCKGSKKYISM